MDICEKVAYIKGLAEGLALDDSTKEGKVLAAIIDVLGDITNEICEIEDGCDELMEQLDAVDRTAEQSLNLILTAATAAAATVKTIPTQTRKNNFLKRNSECVMRNFKMSRS